MVGLSLLLVLSSFFISSILLYEIEFWFYGLMLDNKNTNNFIKHLLDTTNAPL